jgi:hypothetical protein
MGSYITPGAMLYVTLGSKTNATHHEVKTWRVIDRDEFDRINDLDILRRDLGWK